VTLETVHQLDLKVFAHVCDSETGKQLDGQLTSGQLVHKYKDGDGSRRGVHEGPFRWRGADVFATGMQQGITNAGTHRPPAFDECQRCDDRGVMEGMLRGTIMRARDRRLVGCELRAAYRLRFDPSSDQGALAVCGGPLRARSYAPAPISRGVRALTLVGVPCSLRRKRQAGRSGNPTRAAEPITDALLWNYAVWWTWNAGD